MSCSSGIFSILVIQNPSVFKQRSRGWPSQKPSPLPVILRMLGFLSSSFSRKIRKYIIPGDLDRSLQYCWWKKSGVHQLIGSSSHYLQGFLISQVVGNLISEPSTVSQDSLKIPPKLPSPSDSSWTTSLTPQKHRENKHIGSDVFSEGLLGPFWRVTKNWANWANWKCVFKQINTIRKRNLGWEYCSLKNYSKNLTHPLISPAFRGKMFC